jgi:hypothetical protein
VRRSRFGRTASVHSRRPQCPLHSSSYLGNERSHHMLTLLKTKDELQEKKEEIEAFFHRYF